MCVCCWGVNEIKDGQKLDIEFEEKLRVRGGSARKNAVVWWVGGGGGANISLPSLSIPSVNKSSTIDWVWPGMSAGAWPGICLLVYAV